VLADDVQLGTEEHPLMIPRSTRPGSRSGTENVDFVLPNEAISNAKAVTEQPFTLPQDVITVPKDGEHERSLLERGSEALRILKGAAPDVNYGGSANETLQYWFSQADTPDEAAKLLNDNYGPGNFGQDPNGTWVVKERGQWVPVMSQGTIPKFLQRTGTEMAGSQEVLRLQERLRLSSQIHG
jgi:hypothetical protein